MAGKRSLRRNTGTQISAKPKPVQSSAPALSVWAREHSRAILLVLLAVGSVRIVSTYNVFSHTFDEPAHIACGMEWLVNGTWTYEPQHPPLARVAVALLPYLASGFPREIPTMAQLGLADLGVKRIWDSGLAILYRNGQYDRTLALARLGVLPFFWIASLVVYLWARRYLGEPAAAFAVFFFTFLPPILGHSGLATTDIALTAFVGAAFLSALIWLADPTLPNSLLLGTMTSLAVLSKFSSLPFVPMALAASLVWHFIDDKPGLWSALREARKYVLPFVVAISVGFLVTWAGYRFSLGTTSAFPQLRLPAPELYAGIQEVIDHNRRGDPSYLLGQHSQLGWWYYYLVVLAVKTPIPLLVLALYEGAFVIGKKEPGRPRKGVSLAIAFSVGILLISLTSHINLGVRHILPVYIGLTIVAAAGAERLLLLSQRSQLAGWLLSVLILWMAATSIFTHPDYLAYFNGLAGDEPENILVDSDLDWGQDLKRLAQRLKEVGAPSVAFVPFQPADLSAMGFPPVEPSSPMLPSPGWNAVSVTQLKSERLGLGIALPNVSPWAESIKPGEKIGRGIELWYFPPDAVPRSPRLNVRPGDPSSALPR